MLARSGWNEKVFGYCERGHDPSFWAEPLNAWSNAAFWLAAGVFAVWLFRMRSAGRDLAIDPADHNAALFRRLWLLNALLVGIGVGSFCFHTFATRWAGLADVGFIVLWVCWFLWVAFRRVLGWRAFVALAALGLHLSLSVALLLVTRWFLMSYLPTALAAYLLAVHATRTRLPGGCPLWASAIVFTLSMTAAGLDAPLCERVPTGTHFLWHVLNATALLLASVGLGRNLLAPTRKPDPA
jgi:hypothetical protein